MQRNTSSPLLLPTGTSAITPGGPEDSVAGISPSPHAYLDELEGKSRRNYDFATPPQDIPLEKLYPKHAAALSIDEIAAIWREIDSGQEQHVEDVEVDEEPPKDKKDKHPLTSPAQPKSKKRLSVNVSTLATDHIYRSIRFPQLLDDVLNVDGVQDKIAAAKKKDVTWQVSKKITINLQGGDYELQLNDSGDVVQVERIVNFIYFRKPKSVSASSTTEPSLKATPHDQFAVLGEKLGEGAWGLVYAASSYTRLNERLRESPYEIGKPLPCIIKIPKESPSWLVSLKRWIFRESQNIVEQFRRESEITALAHRGVGALKRVYLNDPHKKQPVETPVILMPYLGATTLDAVLKNPHLLDNVPSSIKREMCSLLVRKLILFNHDTQCIHNDCKGDNILVTIVHLGGGQYRLVPTLTNPIDYGKAHAPGQPGLFGNTDYQPWESYLGVWLGKLFGIEIKTEKVDVYALGKTLLNVTRLLKIRARSELEREMCREYKKLCKEMTAIFPWNRPTLLQTLQRMDAIHMYYSEQEAIIAIQEADNAALPDNQQKPIYAPAPKPRKNFIEKHYKALIITSLVVGLIAAAILVGVCTFGIGGASLVGLGLAAVAAVHFLGGSIGIGTGIGVAVAVTYAGAALLLGPIIGAMGALIRDVIKHARQSAAQKTIAAERAARARAEAAEPARAMGVGQVAILRTLSTSSHTPPPSPPPLATPESHRAPPPYSAAAAAAVCFSPLPTQQPTDKRENEDDFDEWERQEADGQAFLQGQPSASARPSLLSASSGPQLN